MDALRVMDEQDIAEFEVRPEAMAAYNAQIQSKLPGTVWMSGCASWSKTAEDWAGEMPKKEKKITVYVVCLINFFHS